MTVQSNNTCPSLLQLTSYYEIVNHPQDLLCGAFQENNDALFYIKSLWDSYKDNATFLGLNHIMRDIETTLINECSHEFKILSINLTPEYKRVLLINNVKMLFEKLAKELEIPIDCYDWSSLQQMWEDETLIHMWNDGIRLRILEVAPKLTTAKEIRDWLADPVNAIYLGEHFRGLGLHTSKAKALPPEIIHFTHIEGINFTRDQIKFIPEFLCQIPTLEYINLKRNHIYGIPDSTFNCKSLTSIDLSENRISIIPNAISQLTTLKTLDLGRNRITMIPEGICKLTNLQELNLRNNKILCISSSLVPLKKLYSLDLGNNPLPFHFDDIEHFGSKFLGDLCIGGEEKNLELVQSFLSKVGTLNAYECTGSYSKFVREVLQACSEGRYDLIREAFDDDLYGRDKDLICEVFLSIKHPGRSFNYPHYHEVWKDGYLFGDVNKFCIAIVKAISIKYERLSDAKKVFIATQQEKPELHNNWLLKSDLIEKLEWADFESELEQ